MSECYHKFPWPLEFFDDFAEVKFSHNEALIHHDGGYTVYWSKKTLKVYNHEVHCDDLLEVYAVLTELFNDDG